MNNQSVVTELLFQTDPVHVFEYDGKIAFLAQEVAAILGIQNVGKALRESKALEKGVDYDVIPANFLGATNQKFVAYRGERLKNVDKFTILYLSGFFLYVIRSNKDIAIPFTRWAIREAIPQAFQKHQIKELSEIGLLKMLEIENKGSLYARQILRNHGYIPAEPKEKQLSFVEEDA